MAIIFINEQVREKGTDQGYIDVPPFPVTYAMLQNWKRT
jgi:hypothetical protein